MTTYHVGFEVDDNCWFAQSPEHPVISAFGDTPAAALHELLIALGQAAPGTHVAIVTPPAVQTGPTNEEPPGDGGG